MTQLGEGIHIALARLEDNDKCIFCGKKHDKPKRDEIKPSGFKREPVSGVGGNNVAKKKALYPDNESPPTSTYRSEGHHCLAFSAFIVDARTSPKDRFAALNHYLKEKGYDPNNDNNVIDLPGRKATGDEDVHAQFKEFEKAVLAGKPLQLHIGGHKKEFMMKSYCLMRDIVNDAKKFRLCEEQDDNFKDQLKEEIIEREDVAFRKTANCDPGWIAHPGPLREVELFVKNKHDMNDITYPNFKG